MRTPRRASALLIVVLVAIVALALAITSPTPALAQTSRAELSLTVNGSGSETAVVDVATNTAVTQLKGDISHLGDTVIEIRTLSASFIPPDTTVSSGVFTMVAANGDKLSGTTSGTGRFTNFIPPNIVFAENIVEMTITSGTGRFEGVSGTITMRDQAAFALGTTTTTGSGTFALTGDLDR